jgi:prephenate dehydrogenase
MPWSAEWPIGGWSSGDAMPQPRSAPDPGRGDAMPQPRSAPDPGRENAMTQRRSAPDAARPRPDPGRTQAAARLPARIAFLGFGLIGGSIALALRETRSAARLVAWTPAGIGPAEGLRRGLLDEVATSDAGAIDGAGLVILAGPPLAVLRTLDDLAGPLRDQIAADATITDVASTKQLIAESAAAARLPYVGGHPMAGRETTGVSSATGDLFVDRPWVVVPTQSSRPEDVNRVEALATAVGARPMRMAADEHDAAVAAISHLPLLIAAALAESVAGSADGASTWATARLLAASGWSDMTRLARGDPDMGAGILATNASAVSARLRDVRRALHTWIELLEDGAQPGDAGVLRERLRAAREALEREPGA